MPAIKYYKPTTNGRRGASVIDYKQFVTTNEPYKPLLVRKKNYAGRDRYGAITVRHQGGGARKLIRQIDFRRNFPKGFQILTIEYDPHRTAFIRLVECLDTKSKKYILHTKGMKVGDILQNKTEQTEGNLVEIGEVLVGSQVSQIEIVPSAGAKMVRSAGTYAIVTAHDENHTSVKLPSGEIRKFMNICKCVVGRISKEDWSLVRHGKAGRFRLKGIRPTVRGKVMNPVDHPHGGGEARNPIGMKYAKTPWGKHAHGVKTRSVKKYSNKMIVANRRKAKKR